MESVRTGLDELPSRFNHPSMRIAARDLLLYCSHRIKLLRQRLLFEIRFIKPSWLSSERVSLLKEVPVRCDELPSEFLQRSGSRWSRKPALFGTEQVHEFSPSEDAWIHDARFVQISQDRFLDVGKQHESHWPMLEHPFDPKPTIVREKVIVPWGTGGASYGDFLIHVLPKLARLLTALPEKDRSEFDVCLPFFHNQTWALEYLDRLGISRNRILDGSNVIRVPAGGKIIVGSGPRSCYGIAHPNDIGEFLKQIAPNLPHPTEAAWRRIYVSRKMGRKMANEGELLNGLRQRGFEIVALEDFSLIDQIRLFQETRIIVGPHGAGHSNIMWSAPGTHLLEVFHPSWMHPCYALLADIKKIHYHCLVGYCGSSRGQWTGISYFGIFENPVIDPEILFDKIDQLLDS